MYCREQAFAMVKAMGQTQKKAVYRAGTEQGPSFSFEHKIDEGNLHQPYLNPICLEVDRTI